MLNDKNAEKGRITIICPHCHKNLNGHMSTEGEMDNPSKGDYEICFYCHSILEYLGKSKAIKINIDEIKDREAHESISMALYLIKNKLGKRAN